MNGDQSAEPEKPPPPDATDGGSSINNGADGLAKKRKKDGLKPIVTTEGPEGDVQPAKQDKKTGCVGNIIPFSHASMVVMAGFYRVLLFYWVLLRTACKKPLMARRVSCLMLHDHCCC